jgi:hydroxylamine reductase (hybrid-cluster protein)
MKDIRKTLAVLASVGLLLAIAAPASAQQLKSTEDVRTALRLLVQVSNDFKRQITNKNFVPHEYMEYTEAADALRSAIKDEPADFKMKVETRLKAAVAAYQKVSDMSGKETDVDKLMAEHAKAVTAMNAVFDLFPAALRPDPNLPPPGRGRGRG